MKSTHLKKAIEELNADITWDNWQHENGSYWEASEVLYCKLQWILEGEKLSEESVDTINQVIKLLEAITQDVKNRVTIEYDSVKDKYYLLIDGVLNDTFYGDWALREHLRDTFNYDEDYINELVNNAIQ